MVRHWTTLKGECWKDKVRRKFWLCEKIKKHFLPNIISRQKRVSCIIKLHKDHVVMRYSILIFEVLILLFYILLTVHLDVILVNDQLDALFFNVFISTPLHVSSSKCSSSGGPTCINTPCGITHSSGWLSGRPVGRPTRVCYTRWCINTSWTSWWWALAARNM